MFYYVADAIVKFIKKYHKYLYAVGSYRRKEPIINDLNFITLKPIELILEDFKDSFMNDNILLIKQDEDYIQLSIPFTGETVYVDIYHAKDKYEFFFLKTMKSLTLQDNVHYRLLAKRAGFNLNDKGLYRERSKFNDEHFEKKEKIYIRTKSQLMKLIKVPYKI